MVIRLITENASSGKTGSSGNLSILTVVKSQLAAGCRIVRRVVRRRSCSNIGMVVVVVVMTMVMAMAIGR